MNPNLPRDFRFKIRRDKDTASVLVDLLYNTTNVHWSSFIMHIGMHFDKWWKKQINEQD